MYAVVEFTDNNEVALVPKIWLEGNRCCAWPPYKSTTRINVAVKNGEVVGADWKSFPVRIMYEHESYDRARTKLADAERHSDLATDDDRERKRRRRSPGRFSSPDTSPDSPQRKRPACTKLPRPAVPKASLPAAPPKPALSPVSRRQPPVTPAAFSPEKARDTQVFTLLNKILLELKKHRVILDELQLSKGIGPADETEMPEDVQFPLATVEDMGALDKKLSDDKLVFKSVVKHLAVLGGKNVKEASSRLMKATIANPLADLYNFHGKKGKRSFGDLQLPLVMHKCLQRNPPTQNATLKDLEEQIKEWLRGAKDRDGGRKRRSATISRPTPAEDPALPAPPPTDI